LNAKSYHLVNATMHSIATLCLALLMRPLLQKKREWIRLAAALAFAAHPIHCEAVASVVGRAELGHTLHTLLALLAYRNHLIARKEEEEEDVEHSSSTNGGGLLLSLQQLMHRVVSTICCCCYPSSSSSSSNNKTKRKKKEEETLLEASSSSTSSSSVRRERHHEHLLPSSSSWMGGAKSMLYLTSSCCLAWTAIIWKENGIKALPLCAIMELMASAITCSSRSGSSSSTSTGVVHTQV
jgi:hypothetical protein